MPERARGGLALACLLLASACLDHDLPPGEGGEARDSFIAQQDDFADFSDWMAFETTQEGEHGGVLGTITEYLSELPPDDAESFPVGTMIVKTVEPVQGMAPAVHAMVKRGGTFNMRGALGWEYFELKLNADDVPVIVWRGAKPPTGERYRSLLRQNDLDESRMEVDCNSCHVASDNDAVLSDMLVLDALAGP